MNTDTSAYAPYLKILLEIAASQDNFSNQQTVAELNRLLVELRDDIKESLRLLTEAEDIEVINHGTFLTTNQKEFDEIEDRLKNLYEELSTVRADIVTQQGIFDKNTATKEEYESILTTHQQKCKELYAKYVRETGERLEEDRVINEVKDLFKESDENLPSVEDDLNVKQGRGEAVADYSIFDTDFLTEEDIDDDGNEKQYSLKGKSSSRLVNDAEEDLFAS